MRITLETQALTPNIINRLLQVNSVTLGLCDKGVIMDASPKQVQVLSEEHVAFGR